MVNIIKTDEKAMHPTFKCKGCGFDHKSFYDPTFCPHCGEKVKRILDKFPRVNWDWNGTPRYIYWVYGGLSWRQESREWALNYLTDGHRVKVELIK